MTIGRSAKKYYSRLLHATALVALFSLTGSSIGALPCVPVARWATIESSGVLPITDAELFSRLARDSVVLLGERHDHADDHRWQLQTLVALHVVRPDMVIGFEMFPRRVQPILDRWVAGELTESAFLGALDWQRIWDMDPQLYLPLFHYARMNRVPMLALNVDRELVRRIRLLGFDGVAAGQRDGIGRPAAASSAYLDRLSRVYAEHPHGPVKPDAVAHGDPDFSRFVEAQQFWDRAMAQGIATALVRNPGVLVIGIMGKGHVEHGYGVASQLSALGVHTVAGLLPWDATDSCSKLTPDYADAVFGLPPLTPTTEAKRPQLGIQVETTAEGVLIRKVVAGSIAQQAGMHDGDVVTEAAGTLIRQYLDLTTVVQRQAPGTWLPLQLKRQGKKLDIVAKFPPLPP
jgi:uncharacterized iron-regulated protein